jgi:hypothetical protein
MEIIMKTTTRFAAITLAVFSLAAANAVFAYQGHGQGQGPGAGPAACEAQGMGCGMGHGMGHGHGMRGGMHGPETPAVTAARLSDLKTELKIGATQEGAWQGYTAVVQQQAEQRQVLRTQMQAQMQAQVQDPQAVTPADRASRREAMQQMRETHLAAREAALKDLYAVLTPEQKAVADQRLRGSYGQRMTMRGPGR